MPLRDPSEAASTRLDHRALPLSGPDDSAGSSPTQAPASERVLTQNKGDSMRGFRVALAGAVRDPFILEGPPLSEELRGDSHGT